MILTTQALPDAVRLASVYRPLAVGLAIGGLAALAVGWLAPVPWLLACSAR